jgi:hypothetical protein
MVDQVPCKNLHRKVWKDSPRLLVKLGPSFNSRTSRPKPNLSAILSPFTPWSWPFCTYLQVPIVWQGWYCHNFTRIFYTTRRHLTNSNNKDNHKCYSSIYTTQFHWGYSFISTSTLQVSHTPDLNHHHIAEKVRYTAITPITHKLRTMLEWSRYHVPRIKGSIVPLTTSAMEAAASCYV